MSPETVVCFKWKPTNPHYRSSFNAEHVNTLARMVKRHYARKHDFVCVTDDSDGLDSKLVHAIPLWDDFASLPAPQGDRNPSCYRRLKTFGPWGRELFGRRWVQMDIDAVVVDDLIPVWDRPEPLVLWGGTNNTTPYNGSMMLIEADCHPELWEDFDPVQSPKEAAAAGYWGSDQGWISYKLGKGLPTFKPHDGVYSYRNHFQFGEFHELPEDARIIFFHGHIDPWDKRAQELGWVRDHWR